MVKLYYKNKYIKNIKYLNNIYINLFFLINMENKEYK